MSTTADLIAEGRLDEVWSKHCGFLDLDLKQFMQIQRRLLDEQLELLNRCELGRHFFNGRKPKTLEEFREIAPLTFYNDYLDLLKPDKADILPAPPLLWMRTSGRTGEYGPKWVPCTRAFYNQIARYLIGTLILASAQNKGEITLRPGDVFLYTVAPPPYLSGTTIRAVSEIFPFRFVPPIPEAEAMDFQERIQQGFLRSLETGIDFFVGLASVLLRIGEAFAGGGGSGMKPSAQLLRPRTLYRLGRAMVRSRLQKRSLLPKDIWKVKGMVASGMDVQVYKQRIEAMWGIRPLEAYACTEFGTIALQAWGARSKGLTLAAESALWEFIPEADYRAWRQDPTHKPKTLLLDEVTPGRYVLVGTSFGGGPFIRYIVGDLISVIALNDPEYGIRLPQIVMESRVDDIIDMASLVLLTERAIWQAIGTLNLPTMDWIARKEYDHDGEPFLHFYIEGRHVVTDGLADAIHQSLIDTVEDYATFAAIMKRNPIRVSPLSVGTLQRYLELKQAEKADLGHLKPPRIQPSDAITERLLRISAELAHHPHTH